MNILKNSIKMHTKSGVFQTMYDLAPENLSRLGKVHSVACSHRKEYIKNLF